MKSCLSIDKILTSEPDPAFARRAEIIFKQLDLTGKEAVLDIGCGRGFYLKTLITLWPQLKLYGVDLNQKYLNQAKKFLKNPSVRLIKADATRLPFASEFFDRIIASEILEHLADDRKAIEEVYRILKPGGLVMVTVPNKNYPFFWDPPNWLLERFFKTHLPANIWWLAGIWADHQRLYAEKTLGEKLKKAGFKIKKIWLSTHYCFPFSHFLFYGIGKNLVEKGLFPGFNRFADKPKASLLNRTLLWPIRKIDKLNQRKKDLKSSVNIVAKVKK